MSHLSLTLFGSFQATLDEGAALHFRSTKFQALLAYLALESKQAHSRSALAGLLWPDEPEEAARLNLRQAIFHLRSALQPDTQPDTTTFLLIDAQVVQFNNASSHWVDVATFTQLLETCAQHLHTSLISCESCITHLEQAVALYRGDFLHGLAVGDATPLEEWINWQRQQLQQQVLHALYTLADSHEQAGILEQAYPFAQRQLEIDRLHEPAYQQSIRLLAKLGRRQEALTLYDKCRRLLARELEVKPSPEMMTLIEQVRAGDFDKVTRRTGRPETKDQRPETDDSHSPFLDWSEAPEATTFYGRRLEIQRLTHWLTVERCRLVALLGMGGMGKTTLAAKVVEQVGEHFAAILWRSLINAPPLGDLLRGWVQTLAGQRVGEWPSTLDEQLGLLFHQLRTRRCLLVLDNFESILTSERRAGTYRPGYDGYSQLLHWIGQGRHQSSLLITSREKPRELQQFDEGSSVRLLHLDGLDSEAGWEMMQGRGLTGGLDEVKTLLHYYSGNPLALKLVAETIDDFFAGDMAAFLRHPLLVYDDIRDVLDQQMARLAPLERDLLLWLAIERQPIALHDLQANLAPAVDLRELLETTRSLQRRSLLESSSQGLTLQNVINEYLTASVIDTICREIEENDPHLLHSHALLKAQSKEYVRHSQQRLILEPIIERLQARLGIDGLIDRLRHLLDHLRQLSEPSWLRQESYAGGTLLNLLLQLPAQANTIQASTVQTRELAAAPFDFSALVIRQAVLRGAHVPALDLRQAHLRECTFTDSFGWVSSVAFRGDGQLLAAGSGDYKIRLWRLSDGQEVGALIGHTNTVAAVAFSPDGALLASVSDDATVRLWDVQTPTQGRVFKILVGHTHQIFGLAFSPDGRRVASSGADCSVRLWDVASGETIARFQGHQASVFKVSFHPQGMLIASASDDHTICLWSMDGDLRHRLVAHRGAVRAIAFSPDGRWLLSSGFDGTVLVWEVETGLLVRQLASDQQPIIVITFSPDGTIVASGGDEQVVRLWDFQSGQLRQALYGHSKRVNSLAFCPPHAERPLTLASAGDDQSVRLWEMEANGRVGLRQTWQGHTSWVWSVACSPDGRLLAASREDQTIQVWDVHSGQPCYLLQGHTQRIYALCFSPDNKTLISSGDDGTVRLWDVDNASARIGQTRLVFEALHDGVRGLAISGDGRLIACGGNRQVIRLWEIHPTKGAWLRWESTAHPQRIYHVAFTPDGKTLASASADHTLALWNVERGEVRQVLRGHSRQVFAMALSADGRLLASGSGDQSVRLWDVGTGELLHIFEGHRGWVWSVAFSADGMLLASAGVDQTVRLWRVQDRAPHQVLTGHSAVVYTLAFCPASAGSTPLLASGSMDETVKIWDVEEGLCLHTLRAAGPYAGMRVDGITGLTEAQKATLRTLGAKES